MITLQFRTIPLLVTLLLSTSAVAELTATDLEKIQTIVEKSEMRLKKELKEDIRQEIATVNVRIDGMDRRLTTQMNNLFHLTLALIALIAVSIAAPPIVKVIQDRKAFKNSLESLSRETVS